MKSNYKPLGKYIKEVKNRNTDGKISTLFGVNIDKYFMQSVANIVGTDLTKYKVVRTGQFACNRMHVGRDKRLPVALSNSEEDFLVSPAYDVFEIKDENILNPEYLMMWFSRKEFDRNAWFYTDADVRGGLHWKAFSEMTLPVPSLEKQKEIVEEYNIIVNRIKLNERLNQKLEETAQAIYKQWFVDFEFPDENGNPYKSSGGEMVWNEIIGMSIPAIWRQGILGEIAGYTSSRIDISDVSIENYISTANMLADRGGVEKANSIPNVKTVTGYSPGDILISNIRPYFKKIWYAEYSGGCSNDVLCITPRTSSICSFYLYHLLETDNFFDYVMMGSKGTKMPRGDKDWILVYPIIIPETGLTNNFKNIVETTFKIRNRNKHDIRLSNELSNSLLSKMTLN